MLRRGSPGTAAPWALPRLRGRPRAFSCMLGACRWSGVPEIRRCCWAAMTGPGGPQDLSGARPLCALRLLGSAGWGWWRPGPHGRPAKGSVRAAGLRGGSAPVPSAEPLGRGRVHSRPSRSSAATVLVGRAFEIRVPTKKFF